MKVLVTGGLGYIGSHTVAVLIDRGHEIGIVDDLSNSSLEVLDAIEKTTGIRPPFWQQDICIPEQLARVFEVFQPDGIIHFAAHKSVAESSEKPLIYWKNNLQGTLSLLQCVESHPVTRIVFSSTAAVYGVPKELPVTELADTQPINPYGQTKLASEQLISAFVATQSQMSGVFLRYFNPVGAHPLGFLGEVVGEKSRNLVPQIVRVLRGEQSSLSVFGNDFPTPDGTGVRDYIHIMDLAQAHVQSLETDIQSKQTLVFNVGTGQGYSVLDILSTFREATGRKIPVQYEQRRIGDPAEIYACSDRLQGDTGWRPKETLKDMCLAVLKWEGVC